MEHYSNLNTNFDGLQETADESPNPNNTSTIPYTCLACNKWIPAGQPHIHKNKIKSRISQQKGGESK